MGGQTLKRRLHFYAAAVFSFPLSFSLFLPETIRCFPCFSFCSRRAQQARKEKGKRFYRRRKEKSVVELKRERERETLLKGRRGREIENEKFIPIKVKRVERKGREDFFCLNADVEEKKERTR